MYKFLILKNNYSTFNNQKKTENFRFGLLYNIYIYS